MSCLYFLSLILEVYILIVLVRVSVAAKRHHDHGNSYKGKIFNTGFLHFQRFSPLSLWYKITWWLAGRHGAGEVAEHPIS